MGESLIKHFCVRYERRDFIHQREGKLSKPLFVFVFKIISKTKSLANSVPAASVIQIGKVFSIWTGYKKQVGSLFGSYCMSMSVQTSIKKQTFLNHGMGKGMAQGLVEY